MLVDLRDDPLCQKEGAQCENCGERIPFPLQQCPCCGEEVEWLDHEGYKRANYPPRTKAQQYMFQQLGLKYFQTETERDQWEKLEREVGEEPIAAWTNWLREKNGYRLGRKGLKAVHTCITTYGMPRGNNVGESKKVLGIATIEQLRRELAEQG